MPSISTLLPAGIATAVTVALIFCARILDVSVGTVRIIALSRGRRWQATVLGFFESLIWLIAIRQILANLTNPFAYLGYAGGFAAGTYTGMLLEERLAMGLLAIRVITREDASELLRHLNAHDYGVTSVSARGAGGRVRLVLSVIRRKELDRVLEMVERFHPGAFVSISDVRAVSAGIFPIGRSGQLRSTRFLGLLRKGK
jgi:uncharacterized protein YebE (UPF0316 family)